MVAGSPLKYTRPRALPKYFSLREVDFPDLFAARDDDADGDASRGGRVVDLGTKVLAAPVPAFVTNPLPRQRAEHAVPRRRLSQQACRRHLRHLALPGRQPAGDRALCEEGQAASSSSRRTGSERMGRLIAYIAPVV